MATVYFDYLDRGTQTVTSGNDQLVDGAKAKHITGKAGTPVLNAVGDDAVFELSNDFVAADLAAGNNIIFAGLNAGEEVTGIATTVSAAQGGTGTWDVQVLHKDNTTTNLVTGISAASTAEQVASGIAAYTAVQGDMLQLVAGATNVGADATITVKINKERPA